MENYRLPKGEAARKVLAEQIGEDGLYLLAALQRADAPAEGKALESVHVVRQVWQQYYKVVAGKARWRGRKQRREKA